MPVQRTHNINAYLLNGPDVYVTARKAILSPSLPAMVCGNMPNDGGHLMLTEEDRGIFLQNNPGCGDFIQSFITPKSISGGSRRYCLWIPDSRKHEAWSIPEIENRLTEVARVRLSSCTPRTHPSAEYPHRFYQVSGIAKPKSLVIPEIISSDFLYIPVLVNSVECVVNNKCFYINEPHGYTLSILQSRAHRVWAKRIGGSLFSGISYSNVLQYNTFPVPRISNDEKRLLSDSAGLVLEVRGQYSCNPLSQLYSSKGMPDDLRDAHAKNDAITDRIILGKECQSDDERLSLLFERYKTMTEAEKPATMSLQPLF